ncbi:MAG: hypothetical protein ACNYPE_12260 [Candidatus Azotimanducaceae bacterium WSBS_2022_MAG_OTU7]
MDSLKEEAAAKSWLTTILRRENARVNNRSIVVLNHTGTSLQLATIAFSKQFAQPASTRRTIN